MAHLRKYSLQLAKILIVMSTFCFRWSEHQFIGQFAVGRALGDAISGGLLHRGQIARDADTRLTQVLAEDEVAQKVARHDLVRTVQLSPCTQ